MQGVAASCGPSRQEEIAGSDAEGYPPHQTPPHSAAGPSPLPTRSPGRPKPPGVGVRPLLPISALTWALLMKKQRGALPARGLPLAAPCRRHRPAPRELPASRGSHSSPPALAAAASELLRPPAPPTEARAGAGGRLRGAASTAQNGGGRGASSSLLASQSDIAHTAHVAGLAGLQAAGALIGRSQGLCER